MVWWIGTLGTWIGAVRSPNGRRHVIDGQSRAHRVSVLAVVVKPGTRVTVVGLGWTARARALNTELAGLQLARVCESCVCSTGLKLVLVREGITWARGWNTKVADALRVACAL